VTADDEEEESDVEDTLWEVAIESGLSWTCTFSSTVLISTYFKTRGFSRTKSFKIGLEVLVSD
jgi:hypothetical protein